MFGLTARETATLRRLRTPARVQRYLDDLDYNLEKDGETLRSPRRVMRDHTAHCAEGAFFAAAALRVNGRPPWIWDLESFDDDDHVLALYREGPLWGAVATSKFAGLRFRPAVYRTLRELAMSYFDDYYNYDRVRSLRRYSRPVSLARFDRISWMTSEEDLWPVVEHLARIPHTRLLDERTARRLPLVDKRSFEAGLHGTPHL